MVPSHPHSLRARKTYYSFGEKLAQQVFFCIYAIQVTGVTASFAKSIAMTSRRQALRPANMKLPLRFLTGKLLFRV